MNKLIIILSGIFSVQVILAIIAFNVSEDMGRFQSKEKLLDLVLSDLDAIEIKSKQQTLSLAKIDGQWQLINHFNAPVDEEKINQVTDRLFTLNTSWPVASTKEAAPRFKVADDEFERKISFKKGNKTIHMLFLGSSPGFKKIHVRTDSNTDIYSIEFSEFEATTKADDWVDKNLLKFNKDDLTQMVMGDLSFNKTDEGWQIDNLPENKTANQEKINDWLDKLTGLSYTSLLGDKEKPEYGFANPEKIIKLSLVPGKEFEIKLVKKDKDFIVKSSSQPYYFKSAEHQIQPLLDVTAEVFLEDQPEEEKADKAVTESIENVPSGS